MSSALDQFEDSLVHASQALYEAGGSRMRGDVPSEPIMARPATGWTAWAIKRLRRRRGGVVAGILAIGALSAAGSTLFGPHGDPRYSLSLQCGSAIVGSPTGDPVEDCRTLWPSIYHRRAPRLTAWVASTGGAVAVVVTGAPPAGERSLHWQRLPVGWTQDRAAVAVVDQLEDIATGLRSHTCWSSNAALALAHSTLRSTGLASWHIEVELGSAPGYLRNCLTVDSIVKGEQKTVLLVERHIQAPPHGSFMTAAAALELKRNVVLEKQVNHELSSAATSCGGASRASALWRTRSHQAGIAADRYVLFTRLSDVQRGCAHIVINAPGGGGPYRVYIDGGV